MSILRAYAMPHPPLAIPEVGRGEERGIEKTLSSFDRAAAEIARLAPDTVIFVTSHSVIYSDYFHISPGTGAQGSFSQYRAPGVRLDTEYDTELASLIGELAEKSGLPAGPLGERDGKLDHGVMVPMWFIDRRYKQYKSVRISQSGLDASAHYRLGRCIAEASAALGRRSVLIASGDLSHKLVASGPYGYVPEGPEYDKRLTEAFASADFLSLLTIPETLRESAADCGFGSFAVLAGCLDRRAVDAELYSYEGPFGVGYAVASFMPGAADATRDFLEQYAEYALQDARERRSTEDCYRALARRSMEYRVTNGSTLPLPDGLPDELMENRAGVFVSLYKNGRLRGCVGTIAPTADSIAEEIIQNAVSAGIHDNRFEPVDASELPLLTYKVDVLAEPEAISGPEALDVRRYGVIVTSGRRRGLLLPNLDGVDTVEEQIAIARRKAGIAEHEPVTLERFEVTRHE